MEAGISSSHAPTYYLENFHIFQELGSLCITLSEIAYHTYNPEEIQIIENILKIIYSNANTALITTDPSYNNIPPDVRQLTDTETAKCTYESLLSLHTQLWRQLTYLHSSSKIREYIYLYLTTHVKSLNTLHNHLYIPDRVAANVENFSSPQKTASPSVFTQIVTQPNKIIDPVLLSLRSNYYFPLSNMITDDNNVESTDAANTTPDPGTSTQTPKSPRRNPPITVESSLETLTDLLGEMEEDDPPVQSQTTQQAIEQEEQAKPSFYKHRFSIYRKATSTAYSAPSQSQLNLFRSFCKCLKSVDVQAQILPLRNDININPITTTDQINSIEEVGLPNFFRAYKKTRKTLSGDFYIGTKLTFEELIDEKTVNTWFRMNGYNITLNGCQTSDMVRIGLLTRVRGFTYRDDLRNFILNSDQWKANKFYFRLYFDSFSSNAKGIMTYVLMVDVDRPNIDIGMKFFQEFYDGDSKNSPNMLSYLFLPLYRKTYSDEERRNIIKDNDHHTEGVSVVALSGLHDLNTPVTLQQGISTSIRHLLLAIPAQGTSTGKLFLQIERQAGNEWLLCCFNTTDSVAVTLRLSSLEALLKKYVKMDDHKNLFSSGDCSLKFNGQAAPIKKGKSKYTVQEVPEAVSAYTVKAMKKLHTSTAKRLAVEFEHATGGKPHTPKFGGPTVPIVTSNQNPANPPQEVREATTDRQLQHLETNLSSQNARLSKLEECCSLLAQSTKNLESQIIHMHESVSVKFQNITDAITQLSTSDNRRAKVQRSQPSLAMDLDLH